MNERNNLVDRDRCTLQQCLRRECGGEGWPWEQLQVEEYYSQMKSDMHSVDDMNRLSLTGIIVARMKLCEWEEWCSKCQRWSE